MLSLSILLRMLTRGLEFTQYLIRSQIFIKKFSWMYIFKSTGCIGASMSEDDCFPPGMAV
jgi:hypothetical protein